ncbi:MAG: hypothetical protein R3234_09130 [Thermoanaerobaculia bacterium]|nr:hypothetical protein [Thermoanaerobaculia bacterium]
MIRAREMRTGGMEKSERWRRVETWLVGLVVLHSLTVGAMLLFAPGWSTRFAGWSGVAPLFFPRQAGVFHFVVSFAYVYELVRFRGVTILLFTKAAAFLFLISAGLFGETAWSVPFSGVADGLMGLSVGVVHHLARRAG